MEVDQRPSLNHEFPNDGIGGTVVDVTNVAGGVLVSIDLGWTRHGVCRPRGMENGDEVSI